MAVAAKTPAGMSSVQTSAKDTANTIAPAASDLATAIALVNDLRIIAINAGLA